MTREFIGNRCLFDLPVGEIQPSPTTQFVSIGLDSDGDKFSNTECIHGDGSCKNPTLRHLSRAGWATVQVDQAGNVLRSI